MGEGLSPRDRLRKRAEYARCYQAGRRVHGQMVTLHTAPNSLGHPRLGITASRKVGIAVMRHRLKRRVREIYRRWSERHNLPSVDLVVHFKPAAAAASFSELRQEFERQMTTLVERDRAS